MSLPETIVEGTLHPDESLVLDEQPTLPPGRVTVVLRQAAGPRPLGDEFFRMMEGIWAGQKARGHVLRTAEEVESERRALNNEMDNEIDETIKPQEESRRLRKQTESEMTAS